MRTLLVTIAIGDRHWPRWNHYCRPSWERYAARHGFDVHCVQEPLDESERGRSRSPSWQKCLVLGQPFAQGYDRVVWIDADVVINPEAPSIVEAVPAEKVGAADEFAALPLIDPRGYPDSPLDLWEFTARAMTRSGTGPEHYRTWGLPGGFDQAVQAGVLVLSPAHHRAVLERVYDEYEDVEGALFEMGPLSYELLRAGLVEWLDQRFNTLWMHHRARYAPFLVDNPAHPRAADAVAKGIGDVYFMHFAASDSAITLVDPHRPARSRPPRRAGPLEPYRCRTAVLLTVPEGAEVSPRLREAVERVEPPRLVVADLRDAGTGVREGTEAALDALFEAEEQAIHLEADCEVDPTFFRFCDELLERYRDDERVVAIAGNNFQFGHPAGQASYYFSRYPHTWGWATWRRAWRAHDPAMADWPRLRDTGWLDDRFGDPHAVRYWSYLLEESHRGLDAWDYGWMLSCWRAGGLTALPNVNLATHTGYGPLSRRTRAGQRGAFEDVLLESLAFPLRHPAQVVRDQAADGFTEDVLYSGHMRRMFERARERQRELARRRQLASSPR